jgi:putative flippase GtrA
MIMPTSNRLAGIWRRLVPHGVRLLEIRFLRFLLAGGVNTVFGYSVYYVLLRLSGSPIFALALGTVIGVLFNFMLTGSFVFNAREAHRLWRFVSVYGVVFIYNVIGIEALQALGVDPALGGLILLPGAAIVSYSLNRSFTFARHESPTSSAPGSIICPRDPEGRAHGGSNASLPDKYQHRTSR